MAPLAKKQNIILVSICKKAPESRKPHNDHHSLGDLMASAERKYVYYPLYCLYILCLIKDDESYLNLLHKVARGKMFKALPASTSTRDQTTSESSTCR